MATIEVGNTSGKRDPNRELALVPFIDFLLCLVAFLLVTAVWSAQARIAANANVPGDPTCCAAPDKPKDLHVTVRDHVFELRWRQENTVVSTREVPRKPVRTADGDVRYPELAEAVTREWQEHGVHRAATDPKRDTAVLHTPDSLIFADLVGVLDALHAVPRSGRGAERQTAFAVSFAVN
jgi:biopolymer transport protein ExbD